jgi:two-component system cell cycle response regulator DivK
MSRRILVVEDQIDNRQIFRDLLTAHGYEVIEALDGEQALYVAAAKQPDLILMDPVLNVIPVIVVTSYAMSGDETKARDVGCVEYLSKPFSPRVLLSMIQKYVP